MRAFRTELQQTAAKVLNAQEEERRTIARELHDEVGPGADRDPRRARRRRARDRKRRRIRPMPLAEAQSITDGALQTVRNLTQLLHPAALDDLGLPAVIDASLRGLERRYNIRGTLRQVDLPARLPREIELAAYRIVQEGLTNVAKHARATRCDVRLTQLDDRLARRGRGRRCRVRRGHRSPDRGARPGPGQHSRARDAARRHVQHPEPSRRGHAPRRQHCRRRALRKLRLLLGDDHTLVRHGLRKILEEQPEWEVVSEVGDGREAVREAVAHKPDVAILDVAMPLLNGIDATQQIVRRVPGDARA